MDEMQQTDSLERYLRGEMSGAELAAFEQKLAENPVLAEQLAAHRLALLAGDRLSQQHLTAQFAEWGAALDQKGAAKPKANWGKWASAAVLLAGLVTAALFFFFKKNVPETAPIQKTEPVKTDTPENFKKEMPIEVAQSPAKTEPSTMPPVPVAPKNLVFAKKQMAALLAEKLDEEPETRSRSADSGPGKPADPSQLAFEALSKGEPQSALLLSEKIADRGDRAYVSGMANFQLKDYGAALADFRTWEKEAGRSDEADWCILMACLAVGNDCTELMGAIKGNPAHAYFGEIRKAPPASPKGGSRAPERPPHK